MKRGLSTVVSAVLLVALVMVAGSVIFLWMKGLMNVSEEEAIIQQECEKVQWELGDLCYEIVSIENLQTGVFEDKVCLLFNGYNEASDVDLAGFLIFLDYDGSTISIPSAPNTELESYSPQELASDFIEDLEGIIQVRVAPKLVSQDISFICEEKEITVLWEDIEEC